MTVLSVDAPVIGYAKGPPALRGVRIRADRVESVAVLGGNGAGKSALLSWIAGVLPRAGGVCRVSGRSIDSPRDAVRAGVGLVVQEPDDQLLGATVREDVEFGPRNLRLAHGEISERVTSALDVVGITALSERDVASLSFGERKRVCLAGVLSMAPALILLDEPTAGLDPAGELTFCATLRGLARGGVTLLVATHAVDLVPHFATRVIVLGEGRVLADGPCREVLREDALLARARVRRPWPVELWARAEGAFADGPGVPLTMEEVVSCLNSASC